MKILFSGVNGYIGNHLLPLLVDKGHDIFCIARNKKRFLEKNKLRRPVNIVEGDLLKGGSIDDLPADIDAALYLSHSTDAFHEDFHHLENLCAHNFISILKKTDCQQLIYLSSINYDSPQHSKELSIEHRLKSSSIPHTILRAGPIIGPESTSVDIIRNLSKKIPVIVTPHWFNNPCQPIALQNVLQYLEAVLGNKKTFNQEFDIGGPEVLSFKQLVLTYLKVTKLNRPVVCAPIAATQLSAYWLFGLTDISLSSAKSLINHIKNGVVCADNRIREIVNIPLLDYEEALKQSL